MTGVMSSGNIPEREIANSFSDHADAILGNYGKLLEKVNIEFVYNQEQSFIFSIKNVLSELPNFKRLSSEQIGELIQRMTDEEFINAVKPYLINNTNQRDELENTLKGFARDVAYGSPIGCEIADPNIEKFCNLLKEGNSKFQETRNFIRDNGISFIEKSADILDHEGQIVISSLNHPNYEVLTNQTLREIITLMQIGRIRKDFGSLLCDKMKFSFFLNEHPAIMGLFNYEKKKYEKNISCFNWMLVGVITVYKFYNKGEKKPKGPIGIWQKVPSCCL